MQYFVSIENSAYFHWQTELLIESFKLKGLEDSLVIGVADTENSGQPISTKNISAHKNKFKHTNYGKEKGLPELNKIYSLISALNAGVLKQPFALIHPDMLLYNPIELDPKFNVVYQHDSTTDLQIPKIKFDIQNRFGVSWMGLGNTMVFNDVLKDFFENTLSIMEALPKDYGTEWDVEKGAWIYSLIQFYSNDIKLSFQPAELEMSLLHPNYNASMIHYTHGLPPFFHKKHFKFGYPDFIMTEFSHPYEAFEVYNPTKITDYMKSVIHSYQK